MYNYNHISCSEEWLFLGISTKLSYLMRILELYKEALGSVLRNNLFGNAIMISVIPWQGVSFHYIEHSVSRNISILLS